MVNVVHVIVSLEVGGAERMLERLVYECDKNPSIKQSIITLKNSGSIGQRLEMKNIEIIPIGMRSFFSFPLVIYKLIQIFKTKKPNAVYTWMYHADLIGGLAAYMCRVKHIVWGIRNTKIPQKKFSQTFLVIKTCSLLSNYVPTKIICCAQTAKIEHIRLGYCRDKMQVIPNGYELSLFNLNPETRGGVRKRLGLSEQVTLIGTIGRFDPLKDFHNFVSAASIVCKSRKDIYFIMIGKNLDRNNNELMSWINRSACKDNFILLGECEPIDFLNAMDLYCISSKSEGFPNTVAEAMAMQLPCVVTDVGDASEIIQDFGKVVPPENPEKLALALVDMIDMSPIDRKIIGRHARVSIENRYNITKIAKKYIELAS
ncbi:glycosyltransferase [Gammaproteobacteria bacterium]|nr:glycosyltransferase [Gammaproteobacteria bacterium]